MASPPTRSGSNFFSSIIARARLERGLTQTEFAKLCAVSQPAVAAWEGGVRPVSEKRMELVAKALGMTLAQLLYAPVVQRYREDSRGRRKRKKGPTDGTRPDLSA